MGYSLGVDLGTTFVAAALAVDGRAEMFTLGDRSEVTPSAVYLQEDGTLVTGEAAASLRAVSSADRVAREFKRRLGDPTPVVLAGRSYAATELLGAQLRDVLTRVIDSEGDPPENVALTHPANWGPFRRTLFDGVLRFGGLTSALKVTEPEAAAARYAATRALATGELVAVYDLGGGTFDVTILRKTPDGMEIVGIPEGIERLGGIDFDEAILRYVNFSSDNALDDLDKRDPQTTVALARLRQDCILAKEALSADTETVLPVFLPDRHFDVKLDRGTFEDLIRAHVESTIGALARTLDSAQVRPEDLSSVLLIGGSSRIPLITEMVSAALGRPIAVDTHPKYAVALGAATLADRAPRSDSVAVVAPGAAAPPSAPMPPSAPAAVPVGATPVPALAPPGVPPPAYRAPVPEAPPRAPRQPMPPPAVYQQPAAYQEPAYQRPGYQPPYQPQQPPQQWAGAPPLRPKASAGSGTQRALLATIVVALLIAAGATAFVMLKPGSSTAASATSGVPDATSAAATGTGLVLSTSTVKIGSSYTITASGFSAGEGVTISWTGPTQGSMGASPADANGVRTQGPILEQDPPGSYLITATGQRSGKTMQAPLTVMPE